MSDNREIVTLDQVDWDNRGSVLSFLDHCVQLRNEHNGDIERQAELNTAWYRGQQQVFWHKNKKQLIAQQNPSGRVRLTYNLMKPMIDGWLAKLGQNRIDLACEPATEDLLDFERARLRSKVLEFYTRELNIYGKSQMTDLWAALHAECYIKVVWDAQAGESLGPLNVEDFELSEKDRRRARNLHAGEPRIVPLNVFQLYWGPPGVPFEDAEWILELHERSAAHVAQRYGLDPGALEYDDDPLVKIIKPGESTIFGQSGMDREPGVVVVKELWVRANGALKGLKKGRHVVSIGTDTQVNGPMPYRHGRIPIVRWGLSDSGTAPHADTFVSDLIPPQANINRTVSQYCENRELCANPVIYAQENSVPDEAEWNNKPGGVRFYRGPFAPKLEPGQSMPAVIRVMLQFDIETMQNIIGMRDVSQGRNPAGVRSGRAVALLKEGDDERVGTFADQRLEAWQEVGWLLLETLGQYVNEERMVRILGEDQKHHTVVFSADDLQDLSRYDIVVKTNGRPRSRAARLEDADRAMERGFLNPQNPKDKEVVLDLLEIGDARRRFDPKAAAREMQHKRNQLMSKGKYTPPAYYEDIDTLKEVLDDYRGRDFFRQLGDDVLALFQKYDGDLVKAAVAKTVLPKIQTELAMQELGLAPPPATGAGAAGVPAAPQPVMPPAGPPLGMTAPGVPVPPAMPPPVG